MTRASFRGVSLPLELVLEIDKLVSDRRLGFRTRADFVKYAVRVLLEKYDQ